MAIEATGLFPPLAEGQTDLMARLREEEAVWVSRSPAWQGRPIHAFLAQCRIAKPAELYDERTPLKLRKIVEPVTLKILDHAGLARRRVGLDQLTRDRIAELGQATTFVSA